jgi:heptaprenyl diphosphate synthase
LGLANLPLILALDLFPFSGCALLALIKVLGQGLLSGSLFSYVFLFSAAGTLASLLLMYLLRRIFPPSLLGCCGISILGALASNALQLLLARYFVLGPGALLLAPPFLIAGTLSGLALGLFCQSFAARSRWYAAAAGRAAPGDEPQNSSEEDGSGNGGNPAPVRRSLARQMLARRSPAKRPLPDRLAGISGNARFAGGLLLTALFLVNPSTPLRACQGILFCVYAHLAGKRNNYAATLIMVLGIVGVNLLVPYGRILLAFGPLRISEGALIGGLRKAISLEALIMLSRAMIKPGLRLPGSLGALLAETFRLLEGIRQRRGAIRPGRIIQGIDEVLMELGQADLDSPAPNREEKPEAGRGRALLGGILALTAALSAAGFLPHQWVSPP